jgi:hypothetical protein
VGDDLGQGEARFEGEDEEQQPGDAAHEPAGEQAQGGRIGRHGGGCCTDDGRTKRPAKYARGASLSWVQCSRALQQQQVCMRFCHCLMLPSMAH